MSGENRMAKKRTKRKARITEKELADIMTRLTKMAETGHQDALTAVSMIDWYKANNYWTAKQYAYIKSLIYRKKKVLKKGKFYLYAIKAGGLVKLGYSCDVRRRLKAMQTSCLDALSIQWKCYAGQSEKDAKKAEKQLHRYCKKHHYRGEWYKIACLGRVKNFGIKSDMHMEREVVESDLEILNGSPI